MNIVSPAALNNLFLQVVLALLQEAELGLLVTAIYSINMHICVFPEESFGNPKISLTGRCGDRPESRLPAPESADGGCPAGAPLYSGGRPASRRSSSVVRARPLGWSWKGEFSSYHGTESRLKLRRTPDKYSL